MRPPMLPPKLLVLARRSQPLNGVGWEWAPCALGSPEISEAVDMEAMGSGAETAERKSATLGPRLGTSTFCAGRIANESASGSAGDCMCGCQSDMRLPVLSTENELGGGPRLAKARCSRRSEPRRMRAWSACPGINPFLSFRATNSSCTTRSSQTWRRSSCPRKKFTATCRRPLADAAVLVPPVLRMWSCARVMQTRPRRLSESTVCSTEATSLMSRTMAVAETTSHTWLASPGESRRRRPRSRIRAVRCSGLYWMDMSDASARSSNTSPKARATPAPSQ
mmetsp:Transcript_29654/g.95786  ORF Transcript_29654/g.95786 Transcript_29654/m.95786 type:complete len:280 (+) Transcript_29654:749-1588(+)